MRERPDITVARHKRIAELRAEGLTNPQIAERMGLSKAWVKSIVRKFGSGQKGVAILPQVDL